MSNEPKIKVDDLEYTLSELPANVQELVYRFELWGREEQEHKFEMEKASLAREKVHTMIVEGVRAYNGELIKKLREDSVQPVVDVVGMEQ